MTTTKPAFDMDAALKGLREGKDLTGKDGILTPLIKQLTESALQAELDIPPRASCGLSAVELVRHGA